jgi:hypothetical protein
MNRYKIAIKINELCQDYKRELKSGQFIDSFARYLADWHIAELKKARAEVAERVRETLGNPPETDTDEVLDTQIAATNLCRNIIRENE